MRSAQPIRGVDVWVREPVSAILLPMSHILPDCPRKGIVINLAAMRLFQFKGDAKSPAVSTYPVGIGTAERPSPTGPMYVQRKTVRPTWFVPASIAEDHRKRETPCPPKYCRGRQPPRGIRPLPEQIGLFNPRHKQAVQHRPERDQRLHKAVPRRHQKALPRGNLAKRPYASSTSRFS